MALNREKIVASAQKFIQRGQLDKAIKEFQRIVEEDPKDVRTLLKIGDLFSKKGERDNAIQTYLKVAEFYSEQGFFLKAVAVFKQILKVDPSLIDVNVKLADLYGQLGLGSDALTQYQNVALFYEKAGDTAKTLQILRKMIDLDPQNVGIRIKLAEMFAKVPEQVAQAVIEFNEAAKVLKEANRLSDYAKVCERVLFLQPENTGLARELSELYLKQNDVKRALAKLQLCFKADPRDIPVLEMLAQAFLALGQTPKTVSVYRELAKIHADKGDYEKRRQYLKQILELQPDDEEVRSELEMRLGSTKPAETPVAASTTQPVTTQAQQPQQPAARPAAAAPTPSAQLKPQEMIQKLLTETDVYVKYGLKEKALEHLKKIFSLAPNNLEAHAKVKDIYLQGGDVEGAVGILLKMATIAVDSNDNDRALVWLQEAARHDSKNQEVRAFLQRLQPEEAEILEEDAIEDAPADDDANEMEMSVSSSDEGVELVVDDNTALQEEDLEAAPPQALPSLDDLPQDDPPQDEPSAEDEGIELEPPEPDPQPEDEDVAPPPPVDTGLRVQSGEGAIDTRARVQSGESSVFTPPEESVEDEPVAPPPPELEENGDLFDRGVSADLDNELTSPKLEAPSDTSDDDALALANEELAPRTQDPIATIADEPIAEPPVDEPPVDEPPVDEPPVDEPPVDEPPVADEPPAEEEEAPAVAAKSPEPMDDEPTTDLNPNEPPAEEVDVSDELEEAGFFLQQDLTDEAIEVYKNVLKKVPGHPEAVEALTKLGVDVSAFAKPKAAAPAPKPVAPPKPVEPPKPVATTPPKPVVTTPAKPVAPIAAKPVAPPAKPVVTTPPKPAVTTPATPVAPPPAAKPAAAVAKAPEEKPKAAGVTKTLIDESSLGGDSFDLASELADDLADAAADAPISAPQEIQFSAEDVLSEFKKGVAATVSQEDFATHYDLGIAYKEMGLNEEAVREFEIASKAKEKEVEAWSMIGVCRVALADAKAAIAAFKTALNSDRITAQQTVAVQYELANAYDLAGEHASARSLFEKVAKLDPKFRDAATRAKAPAKPAADEDAPPDEFDLASELAPAANDQTGGDQPKKGKISYV